MWRIGGLCRHRHVLLLCLPRTRPDPHLPHDRDSRPRRAPCRRMENHHLSGPRFHRFARRSGLAGRSNWHLRYEQDGRCRQDRSGCTKRNSRAAHCRLRHAGLAVSLSLVGRTCLCQRTGSHRHAACRRAEKIRSLRPVAVGDSAGARRPGSLAQSAVASIVRKHPVGRLRHRFAKAPGSDAGKFLGDAHGLYLSCGGGAYRVSGEPAGSIRRHRADVCPRYFHCPAVWIG